jgi:hypothetical protein
VRPKAERARRSASIARRSARHPEFGDDEVRPSDSEIVELVRQYDRYGHRKIARLLWAMAGEEVIGECCREARQLAGSDQSEHTQRLFAGLFRRRRDF